MISLQYPGILTSFSLSSGLLRKLCIQSNTGVSSATAACNEEDRIVECWTAGAMEKNVSCNYIDFVARVFFLER
jgi:hypothetical protein